MSARDFTLLRGDLEALTRTVAALTARVAALELREATDEGRERAESEFELVGAPAGSDQAPYSPQSRVSSSGLSSLRVEGAEEVGRFLGRASS